MPFRGYDKEYSVDEVFHVESGKRITEEEVYQHLGSIPVVTSKSFEKGVSWYADEGWLKRNGIIYEEPLLTWTKEGYAGKLFFRDYKFFPIDVCGVLRLREEFKDKVNLFWFLFSQQENFYKNVYSKGSQGKLYQESTEKIKFTLWNKDIQDKMVVRYHALKIIESRLNKVISEIKETSKKIFSFPKENTEPVPTNKIFEKVSGNSGLTEEYIYSLIQYKERDISFIGGSLDSEFIKIPLCNHPRIDNTKIYFLDNKEGLLVIRKGKAGKIRYLERGKYATNDDAYILYVSKKYESKVNLKWIYYTHNDLFLNYSSSSDNGTWNMTNFMEDGIIKIPSLKEQDKIVELYERLEKMGNELINLKRSVSRLFNKEIVPN